MLYTQSRDLVETIPLVFVARRYDAPFGIGRGGVASTPPPPLSVRVMKNSEVCGCFVDCQPGAHRPQGGGIAPLPQATLLVPQT